MCCPNLNDTLRMDCAAQFRTLRLPAQETWMAICREWLNAELVRRFNWDLMRSFPPCRG
jgi:hypothetical protein